MKLIEVMEGLTVIQALARMFNLVHDKEKSAAMHLNDVTVIMFKDPDEAPAIQIPPPGFMPPGGKFGTG